LKLNESIDNIINGIRRKQYELNAQIDKWSDVENQAIMNVEYDLHQLLGNLATYMVIQDKRSMCFMAGNLDKQILQLNQK
jgi:hypothetical protein